MVLLIFLGLILVIAFFCVNGQESYKHEQKTSKSSSSDTKRKSPEIEYLGGAEYMPQDSFELLGVAPEEPAHSLQFGMGEGIYGSGRHTSSMVGN